MHNIKWIRQHPKEFDDAMVKRGLGPIADEILQRDQSKRSSQTDLQTLQQKANEYAKKIGELKAKQQNADEWIAKSKAIKGEIATHKEQNEQEHNDTATELVDELLYTLPNIPDNDVPTGDSEDDNVELRRYSEPKTLSFKAKEHHELGTTLGYMDFSQSAQISGSRFTTLSGPLALMERALANFMLDIHTKEFGFTETSPPILVNKDAMFGAGQLPKFADDAFVTTRGNWLIPTAEVCLANWAQNTIKTASELPLRLTACTPCFRSEAGAAGKDTKGMLRQHQFWKVELVSITTPENSAQEHEHITACAEEILKRLELPYRVMLLCSQDMGFSAQKTYDLEVWLPGQASYREISSCSNCGDFQARRMKARYRTTDKNIDYVHTLNGSGLAIGRTLIAIIENYQNQDGTITIPHALRPYMHGLTVIK